jgi:hypothetical protein
MNILQSFECVVDEVSGGNVCATMHDLTDPKQELEIAVFGTSKFPEVYRKQLVEGAVFYWDIGHEMLPHGQIRNFSRLSFDREEIPARRARFESLKHAAPAIDLPSGKTGSPLPGAAVNDSSLRPVAGIANHTGRGAAGS